MGNTKIEWATKVWNPVTGCTPISEGCEHCYAQRMAKRLAGRCGYPGGDGFAVTLHPDRLDEPLKWYRPERVFVCSMGDLFHDDVPDDYRDKVFGVVALAGVLYGHVMLVLTKRPQNMLRYMTEPRHHEGWGRHMSPKYNIASNAAIAAHDRYPSSQLFDRIVEGDMWPLPNVWLGVSAENQARADERIPLLLNTPAAMRFVSIEPMLGPVDFRRIIMPDGDGLTTSFYNDGVNAGIDWVIVGGETGPGARPMHPDWVRSIRDQCVAAGVSLFFKGWGEWIRIMNNPGIKEDSQHTCIDGMWLARVGKNRHDTRLLDGRTWEQLPLP